MIDPVNPDIDAYFDLRIDLLEELPEETVEMIETSDDNDLINLCWRNVTIIMRAASLRAILEMEGT